jgi:hypothetical protein
VEVSCGILPLIYLATNSFLANVAFVEHTSATIMQSATILTGAENCIFITEKAVSSYGFGAERARALEPKIGMSYV